MSEAEVLSSEDLRNRLFDTLKKKGLVDNLKTQLRNRLVAELKQIGAGVESRPGGRGRGNTSLSERAVNSLIANHLASMNYEYSLSVFLPEANIQANELMSAEDILQLLQISSQSSLYKRLMDGKRGKQTDILWKLLGEVASKRLAIDCGVQTESSAFYEGSLEEELRRVDKYYNEKGGGVRGGAAVEERLLTYQRLLEQRGAEELQQKMARFRQNELNQLKLGENEKTRKAIEKARKEMEAVYKAKYETLTEREKHANEQIRRMHEDTDRDSHAQRQLLLEEIEAVRQREILMRKQDEANNRERLLYEERVRGREEAARRQEELGRRLEAESQQRINQEINKFKQEEQAKYLDRLRSLEYREERVKTSESRLNEEIESMTNTNKEVKERRAQVYLLEGELIKLKQELLAAERNLELNAESSQEIADAKSLKENNAVLKKELDIARHTSERKHIQQISSVTRELLVEREKREEMLKEMGHINGLPTSEKYMLPKRVELLEGTLRTERALTEHMRGQSQQIHQREMDVNNERLNDYKAEGGFTDDDDDAALLYSDTDTSPYRRKHTSKVSSKRPFNLDSATAAAEVDASLFADDVDPRLLVQSPRSAYDEGSMHESIGEHSFSSDLVRDTKKRLQRLETEADKLEKNYQEFQFRVASLEPVLPLSSPYVTTRAQPGNTRNLSDPQSSASRARTETRQEKSADQRTSNVQFSRNTKPAGGVKSSDQSGTSFRDTKSSDYRSPERQNRSEISGFMSDARTGSARPNYQNAERFDEFDGQGSSPERVSHGTISSSPKRQLPQQATARAAASAPATAAATARDRSPPITASATTARDRSPPITASAATARARSPPITASAAGGAGDAAGSRIDERNRSVVEEPVVSLDDMWRKQESKHSASEETESQRSSPLAAESHTPSPDRSILHDDKSFSSRDSPKHKNKNSSASPGSDEESTSHRSGRSSRGAVGGGRQPNVRPSGPSAPETKPRSSAAEDNDSKIDPVMLKYMNMVQQQKEKEKQQQQQSRSASEVSESISQRDSDNFEEDYQVEGEDRSW